MAEISTAPDAIQSDGAAEQESKTLSPEVTRQVAERVWQLWQADLRIERERRGQRR